MGICLATGWNCTRWRCRCCRSAAIGAADRLGAALTRIDKTLLLRDLAYWLIRNDWTSAPLERIRERIAAPLPGMAQVEASADEVYRMLLERSGLRREPLDGQTDFVRWRRPAAGGRASGG